MIVRRNRDAQCFVFSMFPFLVGEEKLIPFQFLFHYLDQYDV